MFDTCSFKPTNDGFPPSSGGGGGAVTSVFGRTGVVVAVAGDYTSSEITNSSTVTGTYVTDALNTLQDEINNIPTTFNDLVLGSYPPSNPGSLQIFSDGVESMTFRYDPSTENFDFNISNNLPALSDGTSLLYSSINQRWQTTEKSTIQLDGYELPSANIIVGNTSNVATAVAMSGDATISNTGAVTLANSGVVASTYGSATQVPVFAVDSKGRVTSVTDTAITGFVPTSLTSANIIVGNGSNVATAVAMSGDTTISNTGAVTIANNAVTKAKFEQIAAYKTLANLTGATANLTEVNWGSLPQSAVTLSGNVTYTKADFNGSNVLFLSATGSTRTLTISNTGFVAGDFISLLIDQNSAQDITVVIGSTASPRSIIDNRGNIINAIFDGTNWNVWSGGGVFNTSSSGFTRTSFGFRSKVTGSNATAFGHTAIASGAGGDSTAFGATSTASGVSGCAFGTNSTASGAETSAFGRSSTASGADSNVFGRGSSANGADTSVFGRGSSANSFVRSNAFGNYAYGRRYGSTRLHLGTTTSTTDATNPSENKEWTTWNGTTANATITEIFLRGVSPNKCVLQAKNVIKFRGQATAFRSDYTGSAGWDITGLIKRDALNVTTLIGVTTTLINSDGTGNTLALTIDADDTNEALRVQVTGNASETWTWLVELELLDLRIA